MYVKMMAVFFFTSHCLICISASRPIPPIRNISQHHHHPPAKDPTKKYTLYFTIDDGPLEGSPFIDSVFKKEQEPADLFIVGMHVNMGKQFKDYFNLLHDNKWLELNNHSYTHANEAYDYYYNHSKMVLEDMRRNNDSLHFNTNICRMPARNMWRIGDKKFNDGFSGNKTADLLKRKGYKVIGWDLEWESDSLNCPKQSPDSLYKELKLAFKSKYLISQGNVVLLCHDWMFTTASNKKELQQFIELVKSSGNIQFKWLSDYPVYKRKQ
ncbi:MAG TPA: polysaccharide deacetylase family protein [Ferruginibacter sp.]|jgi:peptidoglycan/xylan/chitin deacetylase (PgdA/CDA1 family)|nr:polysaccharide deacetylase family protein [Ferruginibacter sp.]